MKVVLIITLLLLGWNNLSVRASDSDNALLKQLFILSGENMFGNVSSSNESIIGLCAKAEVMARTQKDYETLFRTNQVMVNAYCLKGDIALAIDKSSKMYEEARLLNHKPGIGLALQALGNTYMYTNRYDKADEVLTEAGKELESLDNAIFRVNLLIQHVFICAQLEQSDRMERYLKEISALIPDLKVDYRDIFEFYVIYFRLISNLLEKDTGQADLNYGRLMQLPLTENKFKHLYYTVASYYYQSKGNFEKALCLSDSSWIEAGRSDNINALTGTMENKALVLERMGRYGEAYQIYTKINTLDDSLDVVKYSSQLDTLHVNYRVDQLQLETASKYNKLLIWIITFSLLILITVITVIVVIKRKNKLLESSRKRLAQESELAVSSIQTKTLFLSNMSHEIRTPLNGIVGFSQLLATCEEVDDDTKRQCEESIRQNSDLLLKLIDDVEDLSNLEEKEMAFTFDNYDAVAICQNVFQTVNTVKRTTAEISFICSFDSLELYTDSERLQQVLINLLINATKFTAEGYIRLILDKDMERKQVIFTVEDTGCGIPLEKQPAIFNRFEKLQENIQGFGLGLSICQLIVGRLGGHIRIDSEYSKGARFVFTHPVSEQSTRKSL